MARYKSNTRNQTVSIVWDGTLEAYKLNFPYSAELVDVIKSTVPPNMRSYDPIDNHAWYVKEPYAAGIILLIKTMFQGVSVFEYTKEKYDEANRGTIGESAIPVDTLFSKLHDTAAELGLALERTASYDIAVKIYRKIALILHPDCNNGDGSKMAEVNSIWAVLKEKKFFREV